MSPFLFTLSASASWLFWLAKVVLSPMFTCVSVSLLYFRTWGCFSALLLGGCLSNWSSHPLLKRLFNELSVWKENGLIITMCQKLIQIFIKKCNSSRVAIIQRELSKVQRLTQ
jgi:hypothetical protein